MSLVLGMDSFCIFAWYAVLWICTAGLVMHVLYEQEKEYALAYQ